MKLMFHGCLAALILVLATACTAAPVTKAFLKPADPVIKPSIIVILAHDLGYGDIGCYGQKQVKTPNLDLLAAEGMRFTQAYTGSPNSAASRGALLTGKHTGHGTIRGGSGDEQALGPDDMTVAQQLRGGGYKTCAVGLWGLGPDGSPGVPRKKGFEEWVGYLTHVHSQNAYPEYLWRNDELLAFDQNANGGRGMYAHDLFTKAGVNFIRINSPAPEDPNRRYFLLLSYTIPHADPDRYKKVGNGFDVPSDEPYSREKWPQPAKSRAAMIARLDADVGKILAQIKKSKADEKTLVIFTSDNGPASAGGVDTKFFESTGGLRGGKGELYEGGLRVPMIARWPGRIPVGATNDAPWALWDLMPTALELARIEPPKGLDGRSVLPALLGDKQFKPQEFLYWETAEPVFQQAVRMGDWKAIRTAPGKSLVLYHLKNDPSETKDVAASQPEVIAQIEAYLKTARTEPARPPAAAVPARADAGKVPGN